jgi:large subunit ribosomal protein L19
MADLVRQAVLKNQDNKDFPKFSSGDTVSVSVKVKEGEKERIQVFKGVVLKIQGSGTNRTFTVRKISEGIGVERTFPFNSPIVDSVEINAYGKTRRSRLFYLRALQGRAAKVKSELAVMREQREKAKAEAEAANT